MAKTGIFTAVSLAALFAAGCATSPAPGAVAGVSSPAGTGAAESAAAEAPPAEPAGDDRLPLAKTEMALPSAPPAGCEARVGGGQLRRSAIKRTVDAGLGRWLQTVSVDPLRTRGHFRGWIIRSLNPRDRCYADLDLRAGDVVTRVNGRLVEHPEEAFEVWTTLPSSPELTIDFLRDGQARTVRFGIVDQ